MRNYFLSIITIILLTQLALSDTKSPATAEIQQVICTGTTGVFAALVKEFNEHVFWVGVGPANVVVTTNPITGTWTILEIRGEVTCVLASGAKSKLVYPQASI